MQHDDLIATAAPGYPGGPEASSAAGPYCSVCGLDPFAAASGSCAACAGAVAARFAAPAPVAGLDADAEPVLELADADGPIELPPVSEPDLLTEAEAAAAYDAWHALIAIKDRLARVPVYATDPYGSQALGRMAALAEVAGDAAFDFLNNSATYGRSAIARAAIERHYGR